jgi:predicted ATPase
MLDPRDLAVLDLAAVLGAEFDARLLAAAGQRPMPEVVASLERAELAGLVHRQPGEAGRFSFVHALFRTARYEAIELGHRRQLHRQVARVLETGIDERLLPELARHASVAAPLVDTEGDARAGTTRARLSLRQAGDRAMR